MGSPGEEIARITFDAEAFEWRGPAPFLFAAIPQEFTNELRYAARMASYGWGVVPVEAIIGNTRFSTSLFPRAGSYLLPLKIMIQRSERLCTGSALSATIIVRQS